MEGFVKNLDVLSENHKVEDLFDLTSTVDMFSGFLEETKNFSISAIVSNFGTGKSTLLHLIEQNEKLVNKWVLFDAWKYPEKSNLWEGFVLDFAKQISKETFDEARKKMDGTQNDDKVALLNTVASGIGIFLPGADIIKNLGHFYKTSPARRVFEIQEILVGILNKEEKSSIRIVVEDIDRSGDAGVYFLETLKQFLFEVKASTEKEVRVIVPISTPNFFSKNQSSYFKILDYIQFYDPKPPSVYRLIDSSVKEEYILDAVHKEHLVGFLKELYRAYPSSMTHRILKMILRNANASFVNKLKAGYEPDWRMCVLFEATRYFEKENETGKKMFDSIREQNRLHTNSIFGKFAIAIFDNAKILHENRGFSAFEFVDERKPTPWVSSGGTRVGDPKTYAISSFYIKS